MFGNQSIATKAFVIILLILAVAWILYSFNVSFPKINLQIDKKPKKEKSNKSRASREDDEEEEESYEEEHSETKHNFGQPVSRSLIKSLIKNKIETKIQEKEKTMKIKPIINFSAEKPTFHINTLELSTDQTVTIDEAFLMEKAKALQNKLMEFNVPIMIEGFDIGPSIVQIRIKPDEGIRLSTIESLSNDISLSLKSKSVRIVAPIPGTDCVGIQLPNPKPIMVKLGDIL